MIILLVILLLCAMYLIGKFEEEVKNLQTQLFHLQTQYNTVCLALKRLEFETAVENELSLIREEIEDDLDLGGEEYGI